MQIDLGPRYEYQRELGRGGAGRVLLVHDRHLDDDVALKVLHKPQPGAAELERFKREFEVLSRIEHPGIARAHDFGYLGERPFFSSEYVRGSTLRGKVARAHPMELCRRLVDVVEAVSFLHAEGILHLDIKPSNIIAPAGGPRRRLVLIDFGLCRCGGAAEPLSMLQGSLPYMAPEFFHTEELAPWTDVYALGVTLYRLTTGRYPRRGAAATETAADEAGWDPAPRPPSLDAAGLHEDLNGVVLKCLSLDPRSRFANAGEILEALGTVVGRRSRRTSRKSSPRRQLPTFGRRAELEASERFLDSAASVNAEPGEATAHAPAGPSTRVLFITGPPGMGQSHLLREVKVRAQTRGLHFYLERGYAGKPAIPGALLRCLGNHMVKKARSRWDAFISRLRRPRRPSRNDFSDDEVRSRRGGEVTHALRSVREPLVIAVDGLELFDEVSIALILDVVRFLDERPGETGVSAALGFREEGTAAPLLSTLASGLLQPGRSSIITLVPLGPRETLALHSHAGRAPPRSGERIADGGLSLFQETGGIPARIVAAANAIVRSDDTGDTARSSASGGVDIDPEDRRLLLTLDMLRKPATAAELARYVGSSRARVHRRLKRLLLTELVSEANAPTGARAAWLPAPAVSRLVGSATLAERRRMHRTIARELLRTRPPPSDPRLLEAVHHAGQGGVRSILIENGPAVAGYLAATFQSRAALELLKAVHEVVPQRRRVLGIQVVLEIAALEARLGEFDAGIEFVRGALAAAARPTGPWRVRLLLRLATLYIRRGDFRQADSLFSEGLSDGQRLLGRDEFLYFLNEHAAMKAFVGEHDRAIDMCEHGLRIAGDSRDVEIRDVALNFYATRANVSLRTFRFDEATRDFEAALDIAEAIGSQTNRAVILNNLGIVYSQCERFPEATRAFREAERICRRFDEGPSLTAIYGNLALLHSKLGDFEAAEGALVKAETLTSSPASRETEETRGARGQREAFFLEHHRGLALLLRGRYSAARPHFESAIALGEPMGDRFVVAFDRLYRAEALVFEAAYDEAAAELAGLRDSGTRVWRMALCRQAFLAALTEQEALRRQAIDEVLRVEPDRPVPFLDAWDDVFLAWSHSLSGEYGEAHGLLRRAMRYFRAHGLRPAESLAAWVEAEACFLEGEARSALETLEKVSPRQDLVAVLRPLLLARLSLELDIDRARTAAALAEAGSALVGQCLPEWRLRLDALQAELHESVEGSAVSVVDDIARRRARLASVLSDDVREAYLGSGHWKTWTAEGTRNRQAPRRRRRSRDEPGVAASKAADEITTTASSETVALRGETGDAAGQGVVAISPAMRSLLDSLERIRDSDFPVVIAGETGSGKEMVARMIHAESGRHAGPFEVLDCVTIPAGLIEVELFGAHSGAFTGLVDDRPGLLAQAAGGTVLIDEIAGLSLDVQAKFLRVLSEGAVRAVGSTAWEDLDVRFLFLTSRDIEVETREGRFRSDLLHRIKVLSVEVPPLRERHEDIEPLVRLFLQAGEGEPVSVAPGVIDYLKSLRWPGNVRELKNLVWRLGVENSTYISLEAVEAATSHARSGGLLTQDLLARADLGELKERIEREYVTFHLRRLRGDLDELSRFLGISVKHCYRRCRSLGIRVRQERRRFR